MNRIGAAANASARIGRAGIELPEAGEEQGEEGGREWRPRAPRRALRFVHRG